MAPFVHTIEIDRSPADVFAYIDDLARHDEWQPSIVSTNVLTEGPTRVGTKVSEKRKVGGGVREIGYEIVEHDPPRRSGFRGTNGPIRPVGTVEVEPLDGGTRSRLKLTFEFETHGVSGKLFGGMALKQAVKEIPGGHEKLKAILEGRA